jgi:very-short-patch-repair endonuclease
MSTPNPVPHATPEPTPHAGPEPAPRSTRRSATGSTPDRRIDRLARPQLGLVTLGQSRSAGLTRRQLRTRADRDALERVQRGVYRTAGARTTWEQQLLAACLAAGGGAVASHRAAAVLWGLAEAPAPVEVSVPLARSPRPRGAVVHRSTDLRPVDVARRSGVPVTNPIRTVGDLGAVAPELVKPAVERGLHARLFTVAALWRLVDDLARPGRRGLGVLRRVLEARALGDTRCDSLLEPLFAEIVADMGLDVAYQHPIVVEGRRYVVDFAVPDVRLVVEVDGLEVHGTREAIDHDLARQNALVLAGWHVLRYTSTHLRRRRQAIREEVLDLVARRRRVA